MLWKIQAFLFLPTPVVIRSWNINQKLQIRIIAINLGAIYTNNSFDCNWNKRFTSSLARHVQFEIIIHCCLFDRILQWQIHELYTRLLSVSSIIELFTKKSRRVWKPPPSQPYMTQYWSSLKKKLPKVETSFYLTEDRFSRFSPAETSSVRAFITCSILMNQC